MAETRVMKRAALNKAGFSVSIDLRGGPVTVVMIRAETPFLVTRRNGNEQASEFEAGLGQVVKFRLNGWYSDHQRNCPILGIRVA